MTAVHISGLKCTCQNDDSLSDSYEECLQCSRGKNSSYPKDVLVDWTQPCIPTQTHAHANTGQDVLHQCVIVTSPFVLFCVDVFIFVSLREESILCSSQTVWLLSAVYLSTSRTLFLLFIYFFFNLLLPSLWHCSAGLRFFGHRQVLSQPESRSTCFHSRFKTQQLHNLSHCWATLAPAEAFKLPNFSKMVPRREPGFNGNSSTLYLRNITRIG